MLRSAKQSAAIRGSIVEAKTSSASSGRPYALISTDCHAGADLWDYKPYLERRWHDEFDAWASSFEDPWGQVDPDSDYKAGVSSFLSPVSWDSVGRREMLESQGVVAEVLFPNTAQPFYPSGALTAPGPRSRDEYEHRWAGVQAHNRWLRDFCDDLPGRRLGLVQLFLDDLDAAIEEVRWAKESGLKGVLLPPDHHLGITNLYYSELDPLWTICAELEMPVHRHANAPSSDEGGGASPRRGSRCGCPRVLLLRATGALPADSGRGVRAAPDASFHTHRGRGLRLGDPRVAIVGPARHRRAP